MILIPLLLVLSVTFVIMNEDNITKYLTYRLIKHKGFEVINQELNYDYLIEKLFLNPTTGYYIKISHLEEYGTIISLKIYKGNRLDSSVYKKLGFVFESMTIKDVLKLRRILNNLK